jgi:ABC-type multidrug transport system fused ATPase/permease subunit
VLLFKVLFNLSRDGLIAYTNGKVLYGVKKQVLERYAGADYLYILDKKQGDLIYNTLQAPSGVSGAFTSVSGMVMSFFKITSIMVILLSIMPLAASAVIVMGLLYYFLIQYLSKRVSYRLGQTKSATSSSQLVITGEFLAGFRQIVAYDSVQTWVDRFDAQNRAYCEAFAKEIAWNAVPRPLVELAVVSVMLGLVLVLWFSGPGGIPDTLPMAGVFAVAMVQLMAPIAAFGQMRMSMMNTLPNLQIAHNAITSDIPRRKAGEKTLGSFEKEITFEKISFAYPDREALFRDLNLKIEKGKLTAIVGTSGAGKTTIANLILGMFEPIEGKITIDGVSFQEYTRASWLSKIGFVSQDIYTYHTTVAENILFGRSGHSQEAIVHAAKIANAHEFIADHPQGYDAIVGDRGMRLSGGQQQRLAIARAVLSNPEILLFDEATSSLDTVSERLVQEAIDSVSSNRTVIIIAHRLSTIQHADKIIVIENGQVVEEGNHQELLAQNGQYHRLASSAS